MAMKTRQKELKLFEELRFFGTPLDQMVLDEAKAACRGLEITQTGSSLENIVYARTSGGVGIMLSVCIENISDRTIRVAAVRLEMPWFDADFHWLKWPLPKEMRKWGGYVLPGCGACGFDPSVVVNHRLGHDFKLYPGDLVDGFLFGQGASTIPVNYSHLMKIPVEITVFAGSRDRYGAWMTLVVNRETQRLRSPAHLRRMTDG